MRQLVVLLSLAPAAAAADSLDVTAFDAVDGSEASRRAIAMTLAFIDAHLGPLPPAPPASRERDVVAHIFGQEIAPALQGLEAVLAADPNGADAIQLMGLVEARSGDCAGAKTWVDRMAAPDAGVLGALATCQLQAKRYDDAIATYERATAGGAGPPHFVYNLACAHALAGHKDAAFAALDQALARGFDDRHLLETDADLATLRSDPRFARVLDKLPAR